MKVTPGQLFLTQRVCTALHSILPFQCGNRGVVSGSREEAGRGALRGQEGEELLSVFCKINFLERQRPDTETSGLRSGTSLWCEYGNWGCQGQPLPREWEAVQGPLKLLTFQSHCFPTCKHPIPSLASGVCVHT